MVEWIMPLPKSKLSLGVYSLGRGLYAKGGFIKDIMPKNNDDLIWGLWFALFPPIAFLTIIAVDKLIVFLIRR